MIECKTISCELLILGGGSSGNINTGGNSGDFTTTPILIDLNGKYEITIGKGGSIHSKNDGEDTIFKNNTTEIIAKGGSSDINVKGKSASKGQNKNQAGGGGAGAGGNGYNAFNIGNYCGSGECGRFSVGIAGKGGQGKIWYVDRNYYAAGGGGASNSFRRPASGKYCDSGLGGSHIGGTGADFDHVPLEPLQNTGSGGGAGNIINEPTNGSDGAVKLWVPMKYNLNDGSYTGKATTVDFTYNSIQGTVITFSSSGLFDASVYRYTPFRISDVDLIDNNYYHSFFQLSLDDPYVMRSYVYDNNMTQISYQDISFGDYTILEVLNLLNDNGNNPYVIGSNHSGTEKIKITTNFCDIFNIKFTEKQRQGIIRYTSRIDS